MIAGWLKGGGVNSTYFAITTLSHANALTRSIKYNRHNKNKYKQDHC